MASLWLRKAMCQNDIAMVEEGHVPVTMVEKAMCQNDITMVEKAMCQIVVYVQH